MSASSTPLSTPEGPSSVSGAPNLPAGFSARARDEARRGRCADVVIPGAGHWVAEQAPEELLATLTAFLAPYRDRG
jgi:pimeloyl-ACP methyl ester carboxylesterase